MQSTLVRQALHVAIIMDGNGRWATRAGCRDRRPHEGIHTVRRVVEAAPTSAWPRSVCSLSPPTTGAGPEARCAP